MTLRTTLTGLVHRVATWRRKRERRLYPECQTRVTFDDGGIACSHPDGKLRTLTWSELVEVRVWTTSDGPWLPDVFWVLHDRGSEPRIIYPQGALGEEALLAEMQRRLEGFDDEALIRAMGSTDDARFVVWRRAATADG